ncbi:MAG: hypothetical protein NTX86_02185 [Candidatus Dependentiae bacterium]|nr:hypothetical protein [Candidatus Dependentiae bacterium]
MMKSILMKILGFASWLITGVVSLNFGLKLWAHYDLFQLPFLASNAEVVNHVIGGAGVVSLIMMLLMLVSKGCHCCGHQECHSGECHEGKPAQAGAYCSKCASAPCRCPKA